MSSSVLMFLSSNAQQRTRSSAVPHLHRVAPHSHNSLVAPPIKLSAMEVVALELLMLTPVEVVDMALVTAMVAVHRPAFPLGEVGTVVALVSRMLIEAVVMAMDLDLAIIRGDHLVTEEREALMEAMVVDQFQSSLVVQQISKCVDQCLSKAVEVCQDRSVQQQLGNSVDLFQDSNANLFPVGYRDKSAIMFQDNNAALFQSKIVVQFQDKNAEMFLNNNADQFQDSNVDQFQGNNVVVFLPSNVEVYQDSNVRMFLASLVAVYLGSNVEMFQDNLVKTFPVSLAEVFPDNSATVFQDRSVILSLSKIVTKCAKMCTGARSALGKSYASSSKTDLLHIG